MPFLQLRDQRTAELLEYEDEPVHVGRDPACELVIAGEGKEVVSGRHIRFAYRSDSWWVEDLGSRNGTFLNEARLVSNERRVLAVGDVVGLGKRGPRFLVEAVEARRFEETMVEDPDSTLPLDRDQARALGLRLTPQSPSAGMPPVQKQVPEPAAPPPVPEPAAPRREPESAPKAAPPPPPTPEPEPPAPSKPEKPVATVILMERSTDEHYRLTAGRIRIGRGKECELRPIGPDDTSVSRVHSEIVLRPDGKVVVRDAQSRNGTFVNRQRVTGDRPVTNGDRIQLGPNGPELVVVDISIPSPKKSGQPAKPPEPAKRKSKGAAARAAEKLGAARRSFGGMGATIFFNEMFHETSKKSARRMRLVVWSFVAVIAVGVAVAVWYKGRLEQQLRAQQEQLTAQQAVADSIRNVAMAEYERLQLELDAARAGSAPRAVVESLQVALGEAQARTTALETALRRAEASLAEQLAAGDSVRREAQAELERLQGELQSARATGTPEELLDSLRAAMQDAEDRAAAIQTQMDAMRGSDLAAVAQANQSAVGLVTSFVADGVFDGSGFVITGSGYFVTNRHVVQPTGHPRADSVFVTLADQRSSSMLRAAVVGVIESPGPDLALLKIQSYTGPHVARIDWTGTNARQGQPAALIGFPAGFGNAIDHSGYVRTTMTAGIFAKVTRETINFDGFTVGGSSGSPIFNAGGEVVGVHRAGLAEAVGMGFAVPIARLATLLPPEAKGELGLN